MNTASILFCPANGSLTCVASMVLALGGVGAQCAGLGGRRKLLTTCLEHELPFIFTDSYCIRTIPDSVLNNNDSSIFASWSFLYLLFNKLLSSYNLICMLYLELKKYLNLYIFFHQVDLLFYKFLMIKHKTF